MAERDWHQHPEDDRVVDLETEDDPDAPATIDPEERVEANEPEPPLPDDERRD